MKAAISGFGELWECDDRCSDLMDVSCFRIRIRCSNAAAIPEALNLIVEDRWFNIPIEINSWEETNPILLGESLDHHLGLNSAAAQEDFIHQSGFSSIPAVGSARIPLAPPLRHSSEGEGGSEQGRHRREHSVGQRCSLLVSDSNFPPLQASAVPHSSPHGSVSGPLTDLSLGVVACSSPSSPSRPVCVNQGSSANPLLDNQADRTLGEDDTRRLRLIATPRLDFPATGTIFPQR